MITYILRILLSLFLSAMIGGEREQQEKNAGLRTAMLIALGTTTFTIIPYILLSQSQELNFTFDFGRIISYLIMGISFMSGIVIATNQRKGQLRGVTTSACVWALVSVGVLCGIGETILAIVVSLCIYLILKLRYVQIKIIKKRGKNG